MFEDLFTEVLVSSGDFLFFCRGRCDGFSKACVQTVRMFEGKTPAVYIINFRCVKQLLRSGRHWVVRARAAGRKVYISVFLFS